MCQLVLMLTLLCATRSPVSLLGLPPPQSFALNPCPDMLAWEMLLDHHCKAQSKHY